MHAFTDFNGHTETHGVTHINSRACFNASLLTSCGKVVFPSIELFAKTHPEPCNVTTDLSLLGVNYSSKVNFPWLE